MFSKFKTVVVDEELGIKAVEPSAGILVAVRKKLDLFADSNGDIDVATWNAVYLLSCLTLLDGTDVCSAVHQQLFNEPQSRNYVYVGMDDADFKLLVQEFILSNTYEDLKKWFAVVDDACFFSKKRQDAEKNG